MSTLTKVSFRFSLINFGIVMGIGLTYYLLDKNPFLEIDIPYYLVIGVFIYFAIREFRDTFNGGTLEFRQGMTIGFIVYALVALLFSFALFVSMEYLDSSLLNSYIESRTQSLIENKTDIISELGQDTYNDRIQDVKSTTSMIVAQDNFIKKIGTGFLFASVMSIIMKRKSES